MTLVVAPDSKGAPVGWVAHRSAHGGPVTRSLQPRPTGTSHPVCLDNAAGSSHYHPGR
jgi:hypothetical protein